MQQLRVQHAQPCCHSGWILHMHISCVLLPARLDLRLLIGFVVHQRVVRLLVCLDVQMFPGVEGQVHSHRLWRTPKPATMVAYRWNFLQITGEEGRSFREKQFLWTNQQARPIDWSTAGELNQPIMAGVHKYCLVSLVR